MLTCCVAKIIYFEFLDESLRSHKDNILQENFFIVLTSMEMIALCRIMSIHHFKVCMPLCWLAGNTHLIGQCGYDWSTRSMGKAVDAVHDAMMRIEEDGCLFLNEEFMNGILTESLLTTAAMTYHSLLLLRQLNISTNENKPMQLMTPKFCHMIS